MADAVSEAVSDAATESLRRLGPDDAAPFQALRLRGLRECPEAFASSHDEEADEPLQAVALRLAPRPDGAVFGAWRGQDLVGVLGLQRERLQKLAHKAFVWGMYVAPEARRSGVGRSLLRHALVHASTELKVRQVTLGVNAANRGAVELYRSEGFEVFGTERAFLLVDGTLHDSHQMVRRTG